MATLSPTAQAELQGAIDLLVKGTAYQTPFAEDVAARAARAAEHSGFLTQGGFLAAVKGRPISTLLRWLQFFGGLSSADQARLRDALVQLNGTTYETPFAEDVILRLAPIAQDTGFLSQGGFSEAVKLRPTSTLLRWVLKLGSVSQVPVIPVVPVIPGVPVPVNSAFPIITGTAQSGDTLSGSDGTWTNTPTSFTYQWFANAVAIGGATANTFLLTVAQVGAVITFEVTASNAGGSGTSATSSATVGVVPAPPTDAFDDMEGYITSSNVNGLNGGIGWLGVYVDNFPGIGLGETDDMESYAVAAALNGLNGGTAYHQFWGGPYVDR